MGSLGGRGKVFGCNSFVLVDDVVEGDGVTGGLGGKVGFGTGWSGDLSITPRVLRALLEGFRPSAVCGERSRSEVCCKVVGGGWGLEAAVWKIRGGGRGCLGIPASRSTS